MTSIMEHLRADYERQSSFPETDAERNEVAVVISAYSKYQTLHPDLQNLFQDHERRDAFLKAADREKNLILGRSQNLNDHEINKFQKAFVAMISDNFDGNDWHSIEGNAGALELFLHQILGFKVGNRLETEQEMPSRLGIARNLGETLGDQLPGFHPSEAPPSSHGNQSSLYNMITNDPKLNRIFNVYLDAKINFTTASEEDHENKHLAARFLRDTAENLMEVVKGLPEDKTISDDLENTLKKAKDAYALHIEGKKKKFEEQKGGNRGVGGTVPTRGNRKSRRERREIRKKEKGRQLYHRDERGGGPGPMPMQTGQNSNENPITYVDPNPLSAYYDPLFQPQQYQHQQLPVNYHSAPPHDQTPGSFDYSSLYGPYPNRHP